MESAIYDDFLHGGGMFRKTLKKINIDSGGHTGIWKLVLLLTCLSWLPLLILSVAEGNFTGDNGLYFLRDYPIHIRFLLALPILVFTKKTAGKAIEEFNYYTRQALLNTENYQKEVIPLWQKMSRFANSYWSDAAILTLVLVFTIINSENKIQFLTKHSFHNTWFAQHGTNGWQATMAGWWFLFVSSVIFQYQLIRWLWKYAVWSWLLFKFSKTPLELHPSHPDRACGLEMLIETQRGFLPIFIAVSAVLSAVFCQRITLKIVPFTLAQTDIASYVAFAVFLVFLPLVFFLPKLIKTKKEALREYGVFSVKLSTQVRNQITRTDRQDVDLRQEFDLSTLADFADCYDVVKEIRPVPFSVKSLITTAVAIGIPFIPVFLTQMSLKDLIERLAGLMM